MSTLSEADSRALVASAGIAVSPYVTVKSADEDVALNFPLVAKLCGQTIAHKSERGLVRLAITSTEGLREAIAELLAAATPDDGDVTVLVSSMISGKRELIAGLATDPQFGPTVMLGLGGVLAEAIADVTFRLAPLSSIDAGEMIDELSSQKLLGAFRGEPEVDRAALGELLVGLGELSAQNANIVSIDLNPLIISGGRPIAVDALVELADD